MAEVVPSTEPTQPPSKSTKYDDNKPKSREDRAKEGASIETFMSSTIPTQAHYNQLFQITHRGYFELGRIEYIIFGATETRLPALISLQEYQHFRNFLLYVREHYVWREVYEQLPSFDRILETLTQRHILVPESTYYYLEQLGNVEAPTGERFTLDPEKLERGGKYAGIGDVNDVHFDQNVASKLASMYCDNPPPILTRCAIIDAVTNQQNGTNAMQQGFHLNQAWFDDNVISCYPYINMDNRRQRAITGTPKARLIGNNTVTHRYQIDSSDIDTWNSVMRSLSAKFRMKDGMPPNQDGSPCICLNTRMHEGSIIDDSLIQFDAGFRTNGAEVSKSLLFKFRLEKEREQLPVPVEDINGDPGWNPTDGIIDHGDVTTLNEHNLQIPPQSTHGHLRDWVMRFRT